MRRRARKEAYFSYAALTSEEGDCKDEVKCEQLQNMIKNKLLLKILIVLFVSLAFVPWKDLIEKKIISQLHAYGFDVKEIQISKLSFTKIQIENFKLLDGILEIKRIDIKLSLNSLLNKSIEAIEINGLSMKKSELLSIIQQKEPIGKIKNKKNLNLDKILNELPFESMGLSLNSINGFHEKIRSTFFPIRIDFNRLKREIRIKINHGKIKEFQQIKNLSLTSEILVLLNNNNLTIIFKKMAMTAKSFQHQGVVIKDIILELRPNSYIRFNIHEKKVSEMSISLKDSSFLLEKQRIKISKVSMTNKGSLDSLASSLTMDIYDLRKVPYFSRLRLKSHSILKSSKLSLHSTLSDFANILTAKSSGTFNLKKHFEGKLEFNMALKNLIPSHLLKISPFLAGQIKELQGQVGLQGVVHILPEKIIPRVSISAKDLSFKYEKILLKNLNINHSIGSFHNFKSFETNKISVEEIDIGQKISHFNISYKVFSLKKLHIDSVSFEIKKGIVKSRDITVTDFVPSDFTIELKKFPLKNILNLIIKDGIEATGEVEGLLPITFNGKVPLIKKGRLKNSNKGIIKYGPTRPNPLQSVKNAQVDILLEYLKDFKYDELSLDLNSDQEYNLILNSKFFGRNPKAQNGRPLKLGINLDFNIKNLAISSLIFMKIPKKIEEKLLNEMKK